MDQRRKQFGSAGNLSIKGIGYSAMDQSSSTYHRPPHPATAQAGRKTTMTTTLRKTGSIGNLRTVMAPSSGSPSKLGPKNRGMCSCQQLVDFTQSTQLQEQYTRNLQQQIYFLELENGYLRQSEKNLRGEEAVGSRLDNSSPPAHSSYMREIADSSDFDRKEFDRKEFDRKEFDRKEFDRKEFERKEMIERVERNGHVEGTRRPQFTEAHPSLEAPTTQEHHQLRPHMVVGQAEMLQKLEEAYQREMRMEDRWKQKAREYRVLAEENERLINRVKDSESNIAKAEENYSRDKRALMEEIVELQRRLDDLTPTLALKESHIAKLENEKDVLINKMRTATNQNNELQMKVDERKREEAVLSNLEAERRDEIERLTKNIRRLENEMAEHKDKERSLTEEIAAGRRSLREEQLRAKKEKAIAEKALEENNALIMENSHLSAQISKLEMNVDDLTKENAEKNANEVSSADFAELREVEKALRTELVRSEEKTRNEHERMKQVEVQLDEYKRSEEETREARSRMQKELDALQALSKSLSNENKTLRQQKLALDERCEELLKKGNMLTNEAASLKHEFSAVSDKNRELTEKESAAMDENSSLKHEIILLNDKNRELTEKLDQRDGEVLILKDEMKALGGRNRDLLNKMSQKDDDVRSYKERYETMERQYRQIKMQLERETELQNEKVREYELLASKVRELSASLTPDTKRSVVSSRSSHLPMLRSESASDQKAIDTVSPSSASVRQSSDRRSSVERRAPSRIGYMDKG